MPKLKCKKNANLDRDLLTRRSPKDEINKEVTAIKNALRRGRLKYPTFNMLLILNRNRQIVYANSTFFEIFGNPKTTQVYGMRPGEILKCQNSTKTKWGCGTSEACRECGAFHATLSALQGMERRSECRIIQRETNVAFDFAVHTLPIVEDNKPFVAIAFQDISSLKRREVLERIFLHDLLNAAGGIQSLSFVLANLPVGKRDRTIKMIQQASTELVEEIEGQRQLLHAERGDLHLLLTDTTTATILNRQFSLYENLLSSKKKKLVVCSEAADIPMRTDASLLGRVLGNMIKNALEASKPNGTVSVSCKEHDKEHIEFSVHNQTAISKSDQLQIFQRSFSTKGPGRGIGTYCMKLLSENYLHGKIRFESSKEKGTTFYVTVPCHLSD